MMLQKLIKKEGLIVMKSFAFPGKGLKNEKYSSESLQKYMNPCKTMRHSIFLIRLSVKIERVLKRPALWVMERESGP